MTHICVGKLIIIGSDNGLSPGPRQAIIWTNAGIWSMGPLGTNFSEILIEIQTFSFKKMHLKMPSAKWRLFCLGLNVLISPYGIMELGHHRFLKWCVACLVPSHQFNLWGLEGPFSKISIKMIKKIVSAKCIWKCWLQRVAIWFRPQWVK